jgi:FSR family fosmidomycin resistance protein-like MFS transporter
MHFGVRQDKNKTKAYNARLFPRTAFSMDTTLDDVQAAADKPVADKTRFTIIGGASFSHFLNDMIQSLLLASYPLLKGEFDLTFMQVGLITFAFQVTASLFQPWVGLYTDKYPKPYALVCGMGSTFCGLVVLALAPNFAALLLASVLIGLGSAIFHPEASRIARMASGGRFGLAQSLFQVGGNTGTAMGPLLTALIILPGGQSSIAWFLLVALLGMVILYQLCRWYKRQLVSGASQLKKRTAQYVPLPPGKVRMAIGILLVLIFSKYFYMASLSSYFTFYLIDKFHLSAQSAQTYLFVFLFSVALGTVAGGPIGDRIGRRLVIWVSILGIAPFTLLLPYADLYWTGILCAIIGFILASAFPAIIVFGQELMPGRVGMVAGLFYGFSFGLGGIGAAVLGELADTTSISFVYHVCAYLPLIGLIAVFLPKLQKAQS